MSLNVYLKDPTASHEHYVYGANITHNLTEMARQAGVYLAIWHPEELGAIRAEQIIPIVERGLRDLKRRPNYFKQFNSSNGWGTYEVFMTFVSEYLEKLREYPEAHIEVYN